MNSGICEKKNPMDQIYKYQIYDSWKVKNLIQWYIKNKLANLLDKVL